MAKGKKKRPGRPKGSTAFDPEKHCGKKKRDGTKCQQPKGNRTEHPGAGACWLHGGRGALDKVTHGGQSKTLKEMAARRNGKAGSLGELIRVKLDREDSAFIDLRESIAILEALRDRFVDQYDEKHTALELWAETAHPDFEVLLSASDEKTRDAALARLREAHQNRPDAQPDIRTIASLLETLGRNMERFHRIRQADAIGLDTLARLMEWLQHGVILYCDDETVRKIVEHWSKFRW